MKPPVVIHFFFNNTTIVVEGRIDGIENFEITLKENSEEGYLEKSYSSELEFYDDGYAFLKQYLIDDVNAFSNEVVVKVYDTCCARLVFEGVITASAIDWCEPICSIKANIIEKKPETDCLKSTVIWDDKNDFLEREQKKLRYCLDWRPDGLFIMIVIIYSILNYALFFVLFPLIPAILFIFTLLYLLCSFVCLLSPGCDQNTCNESSWSNPIAFIEQVSEWMDDLQQRIVMCGWYHPTALVRDYIKNVCDICDIEFQSSILNDPNSNYYNTLLFAAQVRKGYKPSKTVGTLIPQNLPVETVETLMKSHLMPLFNAKYWVRGGRLIFERKDYFDQSDVWIDAAQMLQDGRILDNRICYSYLDRERPSYASYSYALDAIDGIANEAKQRFDNIIEWNSPNPSPTQSGVREVALQSSAGRFRNDQISTDAFSKIEADYPEINFLFGGVFSENVKALYMSNHTVMNYKFLIWDEDSGLDEAIVKQNYSNVFVGGVNNNGFYDYRVDDDTGNVYPYFVSPDARFNYPFTFAESGDTGIPYQNNLYWDFHHIDNPRENVLKNFAFSFAFSFECGEYDSFQYYKTIKLLKNGQIVYGIITEITINFLSRTISVKGEV